MAYYGANVNAKLYIGTSTAASLPAPGSDTFVEVPLLGSITPPPNELTTAFFNILNDANRRSVGGKLNDRTCEGNVVLDWANATTVGGVTVHQAMYNDSIVAGGQKRNWRIVYPDSGNRQLDFVAFLSTFTEEAFDAGEDAKEHRANFTLTVDGAVTVTP
jgi:hypothetical protein